MSTHGEQTVVEHRARAATADLRVALHPDVEALLGSLHRRARRQQRRRRAGLVATAAAAALLTTAVVLLPDGPGSRAAPPAGQTSTPSASASDQPRVLVRARPLCQFTWHLESWFGEPLWDGPAVCPSSTPAGEYASMVAGLHVVRPFTVRIPDGWEIVTPDPQLEQTVDIRARDRSVGLTIVTYVAPLAKTRLVTRGFMKRWLRSQPDLRLSNEGPARVGGQDVWQADMRLRDGATLTGYCRLQTPCRPLLASSLRFGDQPQVTAVEMRAGVTGRLYLYETSNAGYGIWLWDTGRGARQDEARQVLDSLHMFPVRDPKPVPATTATP